MVIDKIKNFLWPNRGVLGVFLVWALLFLVSIAISPTASFIRSNLTVFLQVLAINLVVVYLFSCLSVWVYEKFKGKKRR